MSNQNKKYQPVRLKNKQPLLIVVALALRAWASILGDNRKIIKYDVGTLVDDAHARRARATTTARAAYISTVQFEIISEKFDNLKIMPYICSRIVRQGDKETRL